MGAMWWAMGRLQWRVLPGDFLLPGGVLLSGGVLLPGILPDVLPGVVIDVVACQLTWHANGVILGAIVYQWQASFLIPTKYLQTPLLDIGYLA